MHGGRNGIIRLAVTGMTLSLPHIDRFSNVVHAITTSCFVAATQGEGRLFVESGTVAGSQNPTTTMMLAPCHSVSHHHAIFQPDASVSRIVGKSEKEGVIRSKN